MSNWLSDKYSASTDWVSAKYEDAMSKPDWLTGGLLGWNETNPAYHAYYFLEDELADESLFEDRPGIDAETYARLKEKLLERWNSKFWVPLYAAVCQLSLPDYNKSLAALKPKIALMAEAYGAEFVADWYTVYPDGLDIAEYVRRRSELGCALPQSEVAAAMGQGPGTDLALPDLKGLLAKPENRRWLAIGGAVAAVTAVGIFLWTQRSKKGRKRR